VSIAAVETWSLTGVARAQLEGRGIALSELYRLLHKPVMTLPRAGSNEVRVNGYGLSAIVCGREVRSVGIDGQTAENWEDWAVERAVFGDADVAGADALLREQLATMTARLSRGLPRQKRVQVEKVAPQVETAHILDRVHPKLRAEIERLVEGDFSRLVIHSPTRVTINAPA
jgi:hypothetical protein